MSTQDSIHMLPYSNSASVGPLNPAEGPEGSQRSNESDRRRRRLTRIRVSRACDRCKKRKQKCTGQLPCRQCSETFVTCTYNTTYARGIRPPSPPPGPDLPSTDSPWHHHEVQQGDLQHEERRSSDSGEGQSIAVAEPAERSRGAAATPATPRQASHPSVTSAMTVNTLLPTPPQPPPPQLLNDDMAGDAQADPVSRNSPELTQTDLEGHYVGPSSGVSFLLRVQKRLDTSVSFPHGSSVFNFGDAPLPQYNTSASSTMYPQPYFDATFSLMLSREHTERLVQRYFDFAVPVDRFLHRPTIESWLAEFYDTMGVMYNKDDVPAQTATLFMIFAIAQEHLKPHLSGVESDMSVRYFLAADHRLSQEHGGVRLASVQARLCQCLWLLSQSRINHCWSLFGTVARFSLAIGLHRNRHVDSRTMSQAEAECRRRTFWSAYSLDNYLSTALGRPRTFHDDDIDQEYPSCLEDEDLSYYNITPAIQRPSRGQSVMYGPIAYFRLSRILSGILRDIYSIRPTSKSDQRNLTAEYTRRLKAWRADVSRFLDPDLNDVPLILIFQRQRNVLNLAYWHTMILINRPLLLSNFARLRNGNRSRQGRSSNGSTAQTRESVQECLQAAVDIVDTVDAIIQSGNLYRAFWFTPYFAFSASVILYVYTIQQSHNPQETYQKYFTAAQRCQGQLASIAEDKSLTARYCLILEELRTEVTRQMEYTVASQHLAMQAPQLQDAREPNTVPDTADVDAILAQQVADVPENIQGLMELANIQELGNFEASPNDELADMTSWGQFDSMVMSGFGGFDSILTDGVQLRL